MKMFTSGSGSSGGSSGSSSDLISFAMQEASKLFDSAGGASSGNKQDAINSAAMTVMKMVVQSKFSAATGGSNSLSGLMGLVSGLFHLGTRRADEHAVTGFEVHVRDRCDGERSCRSFLSGPLCRDVIPRPRRVVVQSRYLQWFLAVQHCIAGCNTCLAWLLA